MPMKHVFISLTKIIPDLLTVGYNSILSVSVQVITTKGTTLWLLMATELAIKKSYLKAQTAPHVHQQTTNALSTSEVVTPMVQLTATVLKGSEAQAIRGKGSSYTNSLKPHKRKWHT